MSYGYKGISNDTQMRQRIAKPYMIFPPAFSPAELTTIENHCKTVSPLSMGMAGDEKKFDESVERKFRVSNLNFHTPNDSKLKFVFERLNGVFDFVNSNYFNFDINGYDYFQYAEYDAKESGRYDWHMDLITETIPPNMYDTRKLSMSMLLNTPEVDFGGGEFQIFRSDEEIVPLEKGEILMFPSFMIHRVKPVTRGIRKSLVIWASGPGFK